MKTYKYPSPKEWTEITKRPHLDTARLNKTVNDILTDIKSRGDEAVKEYEEKFDNAKLQHLAVSQEEIDEAVRSTPKELYDAIMLAHGNISRFHASQHIETKKIDTTPGVTCWQKIVPIEKVGLYVPGGTAPLFSTVLMLATPAKIAGCKDIILCSPPGGDGKINPAILTAARIAE